jgi:hypothetical protein
MRIPKTKKIAQRKKSYEKRMVQICADDDDRRDLLLLTVELISHISAEEPFLMDRELKQKVIDKLLAKKVNDVEAVRLFNAARNQVTPFFASGQKLAQADSQLDSIAREAKKNLYKDRYIMTKEGPVSVGKEFDTNSAGVVIKAIKTKMDTLTKLQANVISAIKRTEDNNDGKTEFTIEDADREQLERLVAGDLIDHSDLIDKLLNHNEEQDAIPAFYEVIDEN